MIVLPHAIDFMHWSQTLVIDLPNFSIPIAQSEEQWQDWAQRLLEENGLTNLAFPNTFTDWKKWADYFINNV